MAFNRVQGRSWEHIEGVHKARNYKRHKAEEEQWSRETDFDEEDDNFNDFGQMLDDAERMLR